jgi:hypothetical protein
MTYRRGSERGQILIIVAVGMVVLLGVAALVVDLGLSWMMRRHEQNAADPAAIAAARHLRDALGNAAWDQVAANSDACFYAKVNGFFEGDDDTCSAARTAGDLRVLHPPISGDYSGDTGKVQVIITGRHPTFFGRIFGSNEATVTTGAVAANDTSNSNSSSLVALQPVCSGGSAGTVTGGGTVNIFPITPGAVGGYVHVNSPCGTSTDDVCANGAGSSAMDVSGGGTLITPYAYVTGTCSFNGNSSNSDPNGLWCDDTFTSSSCIDEAAIPLGDPLAGLPEPRLSDFPNGICPDGNPSTPASTAPCELKVSVCPSVAGVNTCFLPPGVYYGGWDVKNNVRVQLSDGMYILAGGGIKLTGTGTEITTVDSSTGLAARVTIFSTDGPGCPAVGGSISAQCQGAITFTAQQIFKAKATPPPPDCGTVMLGHNLCPWAGILLWQDGTASNPTAAVKLGGQASTILAGTIYAPKADVTINGGTDTTGCGGGLSASCLAIQIISYTWKIDGNAVVDMPYDPAGLYQFPQRGLVE